MKLNQDLLIGGKQIKEVGSPTEPHDAINKEFFDAHIASWKGTRYYSIDNKLGSDKAKGYSNTAQEASNCSINSVERLAEIIPRMGCGASLSIAVAPGAYGNLKLSLMGYESVEINGVGANCLGEYNAPAEGFSFIKLLNLNGSNPIITDTQSNYSRMRFSNDTITTTLRGFTSNYKKTFGGIEPDIYLPSRSGDDDILFIEQPAAVFNTFDINVWTFNKVKIDGILGTNGFRCNSPLNKPDITFCYGPAIL